MIYHHTMKILAFTSENSKCAPTVTPLIKRYAKMKNLNKAAFYQNNYNSDPIALMDDAYHEIDSLCASAQIDLAAAWNHIRFTSQQKYSQYTNKPTPALHKKYHGRCDLFTQLKRINDGSDILDLPFINVVLKGADYGSWSGVAFFNRKYHEFTQTERSKAQLERDAAIAAKRIARANKLAEQRLNAEFESKQHDQESLLAHLAYAKRFEKAAVFNGDDAYLNIKHVSAIAAFTNVKMVPTETIVVDNNGNTCLVDSKKKANYYPNAPFPAHLSIPFYNLTEWLSTAKKSALMPHSWQRIYQKPDGSFNKLMTRATEFLRMSGAVHVIGDLINGSNIIVGEGFATVASAVLADKKSVGVVAYSSSNLKTIVKQLADNLDQSKIKILVDNDHETAARGNGNAGVLSAIDVLDYSKKISAVVPIFDDKSNASDFNDLHVKQGLSAVREQLISKDNELKLGKGAFECALTKLLYVDNNKIEMQLRQVISIGSETVPSQRTKDELFDVIAKEIHRIAYRRNIAVDGWLKYTRNRVDMVHHARITRAQSQRSFSKRITSASHRPDHIEYHKMSHWQINETTVDYIENLDGPVIVRAGMGSRKSSVMLKRLMRNSDSGIIAAHRVSLMDDLWNVMSGGRGSHDFQSDILHYTDDGVVDMAPMAKKLVVCINSIIKGIFNPLMHNHDFFAIDEATQVLSSIASGSAMAYPVAVYRKLKTALARTTDKIVLADADANDNLVELLESANEERAAIGLKPWAKIHVVELPVNVCVESVDDNGNVTESAIRINHTDPNTVYLNMLTAVKQDEKVLFATDSNKMARQLVSDIAEINKLRATNKEKQIKVLYVSQDTKPDPAVQDFTNNPNQKMLQYDVLIYSPSISSGVSMTHKHFTKHFAVFYGQVLPSNAIQMLRRDRTAKDFTLGLGSMMVNRETNLTKMVSALIEAQPDQMQCTVNLDGSYRFASHDTEFNRLRLKMMMQENRARNDFSNNMLLILDADGYVINRIDSNDDDVKAAKEIRSAANERIEIEEINTHLSVPTPNDDEYSDLLHSNVLTIEQRAQMNRFVIENQMMQEVTPESIIDRKEGGLKRIARFELLNMNEDDAAAFDAMERKTIHTFTLKTPELDYNVTYPVIADDIVTAKQALMATYPNAQIINTLVDPVTEIIDRKYLTINRCALRGYLSDCGIDPDTLQGEASQEAMTRAMANLATKSNLFNNIIDFGGRIGLSTRKRPADLFKLTCEQLGLVAEKQRLARRTKNGETVWSINADSIAHMQNINTKRTDANVISNDITKLITCDLADLIIGNNITDKVMAAAHDNNDPRLGIISIDENMIVDHPVISRSWLINKALSLTGLPKSWIETTFTDDDISLLSSADRSPLDVVRGFLKLARDVFITEPHPHSMAQEIQRLSRIDFDDLAIL